VILVGTLLDRICIRGKGFPVMKKLTRPLKNRTKMKASKVYSKLISDKSNQIYSNSLILTGIKNLGIENITVNWKLKSVY